jgi:hypothetical protein
VFVTATTKCDRATNEFASEVVSVEDADGEFDIGSAKAGWLATEL